MNVRPSPTTGFATGLPVHIAIIMDGNRRWARAHGKPAIYGHRRGAETVRRTVEACARLGVRYLTLYAFSSENWRRPRDEVGELMNLLRYYLRREIENLHRNGIRVRVIGERSGLAADIVELIEHAERHTAANRRMDLIVALNYGGRREILLAVRRLAARVARGEIEPEEIEEAHISASLFTAGVPEPDLLIRTSGEQRISNFLLWQLAYTELVFVPVSWPEFEERHLFEAIAEFSRRERRYGASAG